MNTAALILQYTYKHQPSISTLPLKCESSFSKKQRELPTSPNDGHLIKEKIFAINSKEPVIIEAYSIGLNNNSETICKFKFTWSVKVKVEPIILYKKSILFYIILITPITYFSGWGFFGHKKINRVAVFTIPESSLFKFYKENIDFITEHAVDPDKRRYAERGS